MKSTKYIVILFLTIFVSQSYGNYEIPSSFNPVGSGGRAAGISAFIGLADDATGASWNPGGLVLQESLFEFSLNYACFFRSENNEMLKNPAGNKLNRIYDSNLNYLGMISTFESFDMNMSFGLTYQHLYDFNRSWNFIYKENSTGIRRNENWNYDQTGSLSAIGLSYGIEVIRPKLLLGFTLNLWEDSLKKNKWKQVYHMTGTGVLGENNPFIRKSNKTEVYSFQGLNMNFGLIWMINHTFTLGAVLKTSFTADIEHRVYGESSTMFPLNPIGNRVRQEDETKEETLYMPMSFGIGMVYKHSDQFYMSFDLYRTQWDKFVYTEDNGKKFSPISDRPLSKSNVDPTHQVRIGAEYLIINKNINSAIPLRAGLFYDPAPSENSPDDFYGLSLGTGFIKNDFGSIDIAYMFRYGNNVASSTLEELGFSQDVKEHMIYLSMIYYFFK